MSLLTLVALLTLSLTDPSGDAIGDGSLEPPTSPIYANAAQFDLLGVELYSPELQSADGEVGSRLTITMGSLSARGGSFAHEEEDIPADAPDTADTAAPDVDETDVEDDEVGHNDDSFDVSSLLAIIDVYIGSGDGGLDRTLTGPNMLMPLGHGWQYAVRVSADGAMAVSYVKAPETDQEGALPTSAATLTNEETDAKADVVSTGNAQTADEAPVNVALDELDGGELTFEWLSVTRSGNNLVVELPWAFEDAVELYAMSGVHDPFSASGWRSLSPQPSPWAFSGGSQVSPVIDLMGADAETQSAALASGVLPLPPREEPGFTLPRTPWPYLMIGGLLLAVTGLVMRGRVPAAAKAVATKVEAATPPPTDLEAETPAPIDEELRGGAQAPTIADEIVLADEPLPPDEIVLADEPSPHDEIVLADEPLPADELVLAEDDTTVSTDGAEEEAPLDVPLEASGQDPLEVILVRDEPELAGLNSLTEDAPSAAEIPSSAESSSTNEPSSTAEPSAVDESPSAVTPGGARKRALVDTNVERSYLGAGTMAFGDDEPDEDELDESFWHPRSRKPTLTELNGGELKNSKMSTSDVGNSRVIVRDDDAPGSD